MAQGAKAGEKAGLRARLLAERAALPEAVRERADAAIADQVAGLPEFAAADVVLTYLSFGPEVDTRALIRRAWDAGKRVALPCCVPGTRAMEWYAVDTLEGLVACRFGMEEPVPDPARLVDPAAVGPRALALVPGLAFDARGFRIGYGGGFYDRFLATFAGVSAGLVRDEALLPELPGLEAHDAPVDLVIAESRVIRQRR